MNPTAKKGNPKKHPLAIVNSLPNPVNPVKPVKTTLHKIPDEIIDIIQKGTSSKYYTSKDKATYYTNLLSYHIERSSDSIYLNPFLTEDEKSAIRSYKGADFHNINIVMRGKPSHIPKTQLTSTYKNIYNLHSVFNKKQLKQQKNCMCTEE